MLQQVAEDSLKTEGSKEAQSIISRGGFFFLGGGVCGRDMGVDQVWVVK